MAVLVPTLTINRTGETLTDAYLRVKQTVVLEDKQRILVVVEVYNSQADRDAGKEPVYVVEHTFGQTPYAQLQALIKDRAEQRLLTQYAGATQVAGD